ncbi:eIF-2-alpha kinase activator GCN1 isoform X2 [Populus alba x Populus x berolinensis]|uniref:EIF-2-alpha kinase activator GCN1 isoform X2 n=1 Tax=Populus alba x Populus x berolinensis TaxID=444605 RepID=A0AAD6LA94_9ROSI|nr:eIF-2-alpha kinase activator GCN1 isoform X2 [Populus alba x Populus x berolinensis]
MLRALGEMAISNPVFAHSQLPSLIKFVDPLLQSPIVSDVAYETLVKLSRCTAAPLCHWALDIATALRLIVTKDVSVFLDLIPIAGDREANESPSLGLFERIINGLSVSCKPGPLPVDSFTFVFPIMEHILLSPKKTGLHDDVLRILFLHMDPLLPLPRLRMLSALYHVLGVVLAYQGSIGPALNELCLGLQPEEVAPQLRADLSPRMLRLQLVFGLLYMIQKRFGLPVVVFFDLIEFEALAAALDENPDTTQGDLNADVRGRMINAGIIIIDKHGRDNVSLLFPIFENYLNKKASDEEKYDLVREGAVIFTGALAKHLAKDDPEVHAVVKLLDVLNTPSEAVQRAVSFCLSPLMQSKKDDAPALVSRLLDQLMNSDKYGERRGAAFGPAGVVKGYGISCSKKYGITAAIRESLADRSSVRHREGAQLAFECFCETLGKLFEPFVCDSNVAVLLVSFSDQVVAVREAAECAARSMMSQLSAQGVKLVLPLILKGLEDKAWRTKQSSVQLLGALAYCAPQQLSQCLPTIVPKLTEVLTDTHPKVQSAGQMALQQTTFINSIDAPSLALLVPIVHRGLRERSAETKKKAAQIVGNMCSLVPIVHRGLRERSAETKKKAAQIVRNMCSLVIEPKDMIPYIGLLLPEVKKVLVDAIPEVRSVAARAVGSLIRGMGEENFPDLVPWLFDSLKTDNSNVERSGAAQGLSEVLSALGTGYFEHVLLDIIRNCSHQKASMRDGYLTLFKYLPRSLGVQFQNYLQQVLPAILDGLADENESVRDAALGVGHVLVEHYATTSLPLLLPAVEDGILNDNWRIQQSSVELLGDLLFKVAGTSGKSDEGSSTEAHERAIIEVLGRDKCNEILAALYMVRTDVSLSVRQAALHVWKTIVANTPKTLKEIMPVLMNTLISFLASSSSERRQVAARALGELVRKLGERDASFDHPNPIPSAKGS